MAFVACLVSSAHCCLALSICRRLLMHVLACELVRARTQVGVAIVASSPIKATTIMISTRVNPDEPDVLRFIFHLIPCWPRTRQRFSVLTFAFVLRLLLVLRQFHNCFRQKK